jgi:hypothetical protein
MIENDIEIPNVNLPERFAKYFDSKIKNVVDQVALADNVYNGYKKTVKTISSWAGQPLLNPLN